MSLVLLVDRHHINLRFDDGELIDPINDFLNNIERYTSYIFLFNFRFLTLKFFHLIIAYYVFMLTIGIKVIVLKLDTFDLFVNIFHLQNSVRCFYL